MAQRLSPIANRAMDARGRTRMNAAILIEIESAGDDLLVNLYGAMSFPYTTKTASFS
jgi:hypothetical protein